VRAQGDADQIVVWYKPKSKPTWMTKEEYAALPAEVVVRELRYRVESPGFRVGYVTVVTTLLDAATYPAEEVAMLYFRRWLVEVNFKHIKITMKMDVLHCETVEGVLKELAMFAPVYNLVRSVTTESAQAQGVVPEAMKSGSAPPSIRRANTWSGALKCEFRRHPHPARSCRFRASDR
jgi:hypothetical protein